MLPFSIRALITIVWFSFPLYLIAQNDCIEKPEELSSPLRSDTTRIIDPETYEESIQIVKIYLERHPKTLVHRDTSFNFHPKTGEETTEVTNTYVSMQIEPDSVIIQNNTKYYYFLENGCFKISHSISHY